MRGENRNASVEELCRNLRLKADITQELETVAERAGLQNFEKVKERLRDANQTKPW